MQLSIYSVLGQQGAFHLLVKVQQCGPVFFQALHEVLWQVADLKIIPVTTQTLVDTGEPDSQEGPKLLYPSACKGIHEASAHGSGAVSSFPVFDWGENHAREVASRP